MKVLLVQPPIEDFYLTPHRLAALGLRALVPFLEAAGWEWVLLNLPLRDTRGRAKPLPKELDHLKPHIIRGEGGPLSWFRSWRRFGPDPEMTAEEAARQKPALILLSCFAWAYAGETLALLEPLKAACPEAVIAVGGAGATVMPGPFLEAGVDLVLRGEGEASLPALLEALEGRRPLRSVPNIVLPGAPEPTEPPDPPEGPLRPVMGEITGGPEESGPLRRFSASVTRGCPRGCRFCSNRLCHGPTFRTASAEGVEAMLERQLGGKITRGSWHVNFEDDNLLLDRRGFLEILKLFRRRGGNFTFSAENGMDYTLLNPDLIRTLAAQGLTQLNLSLASLDPARAREQDRFLRPDLYKRTVETAAELDLPVITYFIAGLPGDTPESMVETLAALTGSLALTGISLFYPVPGLADLPGPDHFSSLPPRLCAGSTAWPWGGGLSTEQLITTFRLARLTNLLRAPGGGNSGVPFPGAEELKNRILKTRRLHTLVKENRRWKITPVPQQDGEMVEAFCRRIGAP